MLLNLVLLWLAELFLHQNPKFNAYLLRSKGQDEREAVLYLFLSFSSFMCFFYSLYLSFPFFIRFDEMIRSLARCVQDLSLMVLHKTAIYCLR